MKKDVSNTDVNSTINLDLEPTINHLIEKISDLVFTTRNKVAVYLNTETTILYWSIGNFIVEELKFKNQIAYGKQIPVTLSQQLTQKLGKGFSYLAIMRMIKVAECFNKENIATLSQQLSWSHLIELSSVKNQLKRDFYLQSAISYKWNVRFLRDQIDVQLFERTAISKNLENIITDALEKWLMKLAGQNILSFYQNVKITKNNFIVN